MPAFRSVSSLGARGLSLASFLCFATSSVAFADDELVPPLVLHHHEARYPAQELEGKKHAQVVLFVTVDTEGHVAAIDVAESAGPNFDAAAKDAIANWTFTPAKKAGNPVAARIRVPFHFAPGEEAHPKKPDPLAPAMPLADEKGAASGKTDKNANGKAAIENGAKKDAAKEGAMRLPEDEIRVVGRSHVPSRGGGDYDITIGKLAGVPRTDAASLLRLAPGVLLTNQGGAGHPNQIFLRGFDAREGQDIEFTVDGIPINEAGNPHGSGLADTHFIIPELVQRLRVIEGPFAPQQGNYAVAGSALYELGLPNPGLAIQAGMGSFGTKRLLLLWRPSGFSERTFGGAELQSSDGFGENRSSSRATAMGGFEGKLGETGSYRFLFTSYASHYSQAGVLRLDDVESGKRDFYGTYDPMQGGDSTRHSIGVTLNGRANRMRLTQSAFLIYRDFRLRQNFTGFQEDPQQTWQSNHTQRGDLIDQRAESVTLGGRGSARQEWKVLGHKQQLELGYFARFDSTDALQERNREGTNIPYRKELDLAAGTANIGVYADANLRFLPWLTLRGGLRGDYFHYRATDRCALTSQSSFGGDPLDTECFSSDRQGYRSPTQTASTSATALQPRATLLFGPFEGFHFGVNYGLGSRSIDPQYVNQNLATPFATVKAGEASVSYVRSFGDVDLNVRSVFFQTSVDKDLFFNQTEGRNTLANGTTRTGWAGTVRATGKFFDVAANLTYVRAVFAEDGLAIPYTPASIARVDGVLFGDLPLKVAGKALYGTLGTGISIIGERPLPFNEFSQANVLVDVAASVRYREFTFGITSTNLFDRRYRLGEYNYVSDFRSQAYPTRVAARHFSAGEPRAIFANLTIRFGGDEAPSKEDGLKEESLAPTKENSDGHDGAVHEMEESRQTPVSPRAKEPLASPGRPKTEAEEPGVEIVAMKSPEGK